MDNTLYLDHNATTPVRKEAVQAMMEALSRTGNASSVHRFGRVNRRCIEDAREAITHLVGAMDGRVVFTSSGTEANNMALRGCGRSRVLVSAVEHAAVLMAVEEAEIIPVDGEGVIDIQALEALLGADDTPAVVSVMLANNETGVIQPLAQVAETARRFGALVHCDAVQAAGKIPVNMPGLGVHMMSLSAHKIGGPEGAGALVATEDVPLKGLIRGGGQEQGLRAGTENVPGIAAFAVAARIAKEALDEFARLARLRDDLERRVRQLAPEAKVFGAGADRLPNTSCLTMPGTPGETQVMAFDLAGIAVSSRSACSSGKVGKSHVLEAMNVASAEDAIRVSLGWGNSANDIDRFLETWASLHARAGREGLAASPAA